MSHIIVVIVTVLVYRTIQYFLKRRQVDKTFEILEQATHGISAGMFETGYRVGWSSATIDPTESLEDGLERANLELKFILTDSVKNSLEKLKSKP